ncbi:hypothetical protein RUND412_007909 [Rhizina undulata]
MPSLARKLLIIAAIDGLIISPLPHRFHGTNKTPLPGPGSIKIAYGSQKITPYTGPRIVLGENAAIEAHGVAGIINISARSFLVAITHRDQVATIHNRHPVFQVTDVALIPLASRNQAVAAIEKEKRGLRIEDREDEEPSAAESESSEDLLVDDDAPPLPQRRQSSVGENVMAKKGNYGRFTANWYSQKGWEDDHRRAEGLSPSPSGSTRNMLIDMEQAENGPAPEDRGDEIVKEEFKEMAAEEEVKREMTHSLTPKLLNTARLLFAGGGFYFCYEWDITRNWGRRREALGDDLWRGVDSEFFWNRHLLKPLIDTAFYSSMFILPIMQGFVGQRTFTASLTSAAAAAPQTKPLPPPIKPKPSSLRSPSPSQSAKPNPPPPPPPRRTSSTLSLPLPPPLPPRRSSSSIDLLSSPISQTYETSPLPPLLQREKRESHEEEYTITVISRRSIRRAGLRYLRRGIDDSGATANTVETEQLLADSTWNNVFSFLQIRGSIPIYFSQSPYAMKPKPVLLKSRETNDAATARHFDWLRKRYGKVLCINLVETTGTESVVGAEYEKAVERMQANGRDVEWEWFDFHRVCRGMRFGNVRYLFDKIGPSIDSLSSTTPTSSQCGIVRTNCMDCLDRTNVVQSFTAHRVLTSWLESVGASLPSGEATWFNTLWADNGDAVSKQYASTAALKGDFTRTRRRNYKGALTDLGLTVSRYFTNVVGDFFTQAAIDFLLGNVGEVVFVEFEAEMVSRDPGTFGREEEIKRAVDVSGGIVVDEGEIVVAGWVLTEGSRRKQEVVILVTKDEDGHGSRGGIYKCEYEWTVEKVRAFEKVPFEDIGDVFWGTFITETLTSSQRDPSRNVGFVLSFTPREGRVGSRSMANDYESGSDGKWMFKLLPLENYKDETGAANEREMCERMVGVIREVAREAGYRVGVGEREIVGEREARKKTGVFERLGYGVKKLVWAT